GLALLHIVAHLILVPGERRLVVVRCRGQFTGEYVGGDEGHRGTEPGRRGAAVPAVAEQHRPPSVPLSQVDLTERVEVEVPGAGHGGEDLRQQPPTPRE